MAMTWSLIASNARSRKKCRIARRHRGRAFDGAALPARRRPRRWPSPCGDRATAVMVKSRNVLARRRVPRRRSRRPRDHARQPRRCASESEPAKRSDSLRRSSPMSRKALTPLRGARRDREHGHLVDRGDLVGVNLGRRRASSSCDSQRVERAVLDEAHRGAHALRARPRNRPAPAMRRRSAPRESRQRCTRPARRRRPPGRDLPARTSRGVAGAPARRSPLARHPRSSLDTVTPARAQHVLGRRAGAHVLAHGGRAISAEAGEEDRGLHLRAGDRNAVVDRPQSTRRLYDEGRRQRALPRPRTTAPIRPSGIATRSIGRLESDASPTRRCVPAIVRRPAGHESHGRARVPAVQRRRARAASPSVGSAQVSDTVVVHASSP